MSIVPRRPEPGSVLDLNAEVGNLIDELQRADVEFALIGALANSLHRGRGVQKSVDLLVWSDDRQTAENVVDGQGFLRAGRLRPAEAGRYNLRRLIKKGLEWA